MKSLGILLWKSSWFPSLVLSSLFNKPFYVSMIDHYYGLANARKKIDKITSTMQRRKHCILRQFSRHCLLWWCLCCCRSNHWTVSTIMRASFVNIWSNMDHVSFQILFEQTWISGFSGYFSEQLNEILPRAVTCKFPHTRIEYKYFCRYLSNLKSEKSRFSKVVHRHVFFQ